MKKILVPVDFSDTTPFVISYATALASHLQAEIILLHVLDTTPPSFDVPLYIPALEGMFEETEARLQELAKDTEAKTGHSLRITAEVKLGFLVEEIHLYAKEENIDLIIMGMQGAGYIRERFLGSHTTTLIRKSTCPVLCINKNMHFTNLRKIIWAIDDHETHYQQVLQPIKFLAGIFGSHLYILHVSKELIYSPHTQIQGFDQLLQAISGMSYSLHYHKNNDVVSAVNDFAEEIRADMVIMVPKSHHFIGGMLHESTTKKIIFHQHTPILSIHN